MSSAFGMSNVESHQCMDLFKSGGMPTENRKLALVSPTEVDQFDSVCAFPWSLIYVGIPYSFHSRDNPHSHP